MRWLRGGGRDDGGRGGGVLWCWNMKRGVRAMVHTRGGAGVGMRTTWRRREEWYGRDGRRCLLGHDGSRRTRTTRGRQQGS